MVHRQRRGLNQSFYVMKESQDFLEARSLPRGKDGHRERSASGVVRRAFCVYQWLIHEHAKAFKRWSETDFILVLRCLPGGPLFSGDKVDDVKRVLAIPEIVEQEARRLDLARVMDLSPKALQGFIKRLRALSPLELIALHDHLECLRVEFNKKS